MRKLLICLAVMALLIQPAEASKLHKLAVCAKFPFRVILWASVGFAVGAASSVVETILDWEDEV